MKTRQIVAAVFCAMIASASVSCLAADNPAQADGSSGTTQRNGNAATMQRGMMGGGMMNQKPGFNGTNTGRNDEGRAMMGGCPMGGGMMGQGMMGGGMMGHGMMRGGMMRGGMMGHGMMGNRLLMPQLAAGNEKLQLQMQAEILQKVGEIIGKYADKIVINQGGTQ